jgi:hypothetical protein
VGLRFEGLVRGLANGIRAFSWHERKSNIKTHHSLGDIFLFTCPDVCTFPLFSTADHTPFHIHPHTCKPIFPFTASQGPDALEQKKEEHIIILLQGFTPSSSQVAASRSLGSPERSSPQTSRRRLRGSVKRPPPPPTNASASPGSRFGAGRIPPNPCERGSTALAESTVELEMAVYRWTDFEKEFLSYGIHFCKGQPLSDVDGGRGRYLVAARLPLLPTSHGLLRYALGVLHLARVLFISHGGSALLPSSRLLWPFQSPLISPRHFSARGARPAGGAGTDHHQPQRAHWQR